MRTLDFSAPYHSSGPPSRKRQRLSDCRRYTYAKEFSARNEYFQEIPKKRVRFHIQGKEQHETKAVQGLDRDRMFKQSTRRTLSNEEIKRCWYDRADLMAFRKEAINLAFGKLRTGDGNMALLPRGMESLAPIRRRHKVNTVRYVLLAFRIGKDQNFVGRLCAKLGHWNTEIALRDACVDYLEIYRPSSAHSVPPVVSRPPEIPFVPDSVAKDLLSTPTLSSPSSSSKRERRSFRISECPYGESK